MYPNYKLLCLKELQSEPPRRATAVVFENKVELCVVCGDRASGNLFLLLNFVKENLEIY